MLSESSLENPLRFYKLLYRSSLLEIVQTFDYAEVVTMAANPVDPSVIEAIPQRVLVTIPAEAPPLGVMPNFVNPETQVAAIVGVSCAFAGLALVCYTLRIYTKAFVSKRWTWDDLTITIGFMLGIATLGFLINGCLYAGTGKHQWDLHLDKVINFPALIQAYTTVVLTQPALALIKGSLFIQWYNIFSRLRWMRIAVWVGATFHCVFYTMAVVTAFVLCSPWHGQTWLRTILSWHYLKFAQLSIPFGVVGMVVDWYLLILPIPAVLQLQMSTAKKLGVLIVFTTGGIAAIASTVSLAYRVRLQIDPRDVTWKVGYVLMWNQIEMFAGVTVSCMPTVKYFFTHEETTIKARAPSIRSFTSHMMHKTSREDENPEPEHNAPTWYIGHDDTDRRDWSCPAIDRSQIQVTKDVSVVREV